MHIKTTCPRCENTYQVDPALRGKRMRCPNLACRWIFEVHEDGVAPPPSAPAPLPAAPSVQSQRTGSVGDMVPILEAEPVASPPPPQVETNRPAATASGARTRRDASPAHTTRIATSAP